MVRDNWREYADEPPPKDRVRVGHWIADGPLEAFAEWRVRDGAWFVDVGYGTDHPSIPYRDAALIVLALHNGRVVNKIPTATSNGTRVQRSIPSLKGGISYRLSQTPLQGDPSLSEYELWIPTGSDGGITLQMRIVGETVEAVSLSSFVN